MNDGNREPRRMMSKPGLVSVCLAIGVASISTQALAEKAGRTISGEKITYGRWQSLPSDRLLLNLEGSIDIKLTSVKQRIRTGHVVQQAARFRSGQINIRYNPRASFGERTTRFVSAEASLKKRVRRYYDKKKMSFVFEKSEQVSGAWGRSGWVHRTLEQKGRRCLFGVTGFISKVKQREGAVAGRYDTVVWFRDCSEKRSLSNVRDFLAKVELSPIGLEGFGEPPPTH